MATSLSSEINILTLNCWGLKYISEYRNERLQEIGNRISAADPVPNIVGLQECWCQDDYQSIRRATKSILPYGKFFHSGIFGGGLAILSKWPIEESSMFRYPLNGRPTAFFRGDWFVGKGVACARIRIGSGPKDIAEVFTTHLHAPYEREPNDSYICHRTAQAWEIAKLMRGAAERGHLVIGLGDFNMIPESLAHHLITTHSPVEDIWRVLHPDSSVGAANDDVEKARRRPIPTAEFNISQNGSTCDSVFNTWRWNPSQQKRLGPNKPPIEVPGDSIDARAKRLDYIFASSGSHSNPDKGWVVKRAHVGMLDRHPTLQCSLSDHFSVEATLLYFTATFPPNSSPLNYKAEEKDSISKKKIARSFSHIDEAKLASGGFLQSPAPSLEMSRNSQESPDSIDYPTQLKNLNSSTPKQLSSAMYDEILVMISKYQKRERRQRRLRLSHFVFSVFVSIGCFVAVWFSPRNFVSFILMLLSSLGLAAGVIDGLIGGLFVGSEIRALKEFEWEIRNARGGLNGESGGGGEFIEGIVDW